MGKIVKKYLQKFMVKKTIVNRNYANWNFFSFAFFCQINDGENDREIDLFQI
jgi:hypothetical protein